MVEEVIEQYVEMTMLNAKKNIEEQLIYHSFGPWDLTQNSYYKS
jgi:hypothetical protein